MEVDYIKKMKRSYQIIDLSKPENEIAHELLKFKRGPFKTYFVFTTNCVKIADYLIRNEDLNLIGLRGIITPGDYLNFLYNSYLEGNGIVKDLRFYQKLDKL